MKKSVSTDIALPTIKTASFSGRLYLPFFLFIATFLTYYSTLIYGDFIRLDDSNLINKLINDPPLDIKKLFFNPGSTYYRPILELSYRLDYFLWSPVEFGFHQTNLFHHLVNVFLVYGIALILFEPAKTNNQVMAFISALFFAVNPLLSESVCWVSGRSDILVSNFVLSSFIFYLLFKRRKRLFYLIFSLLAFALAMMTKETAIALPAIIITFELFYQRSFSLVGSRRAAVLASVLLVVALISYIYLKGGSIDMKNMTVAVGDKGLVTKTPLDNLRILFASYGFYFKKLFFPYPLNFAIHRINDSLYALLGFVALAIFIVRGVFVRPGLYGFCAAWIILTVSPAIAGGMLMLPWTPWAERFLYLPMAGFSIAVGYGAIALHNRQNKKTSVSLVIIFITLWASTGHRVYIWTDEIRLWEDTASKTDYGPVYNFYGGVLQNLGEYEKAIEVLEKGLDKGYVYPIYLALASIHRSQKNHLKYESIMEKAIEEFPKKKNTIKLLADEYLGIAMAENEDNEKYTLKAIETYIRYMGPNGGDLKTNFKVASLYKNINRPEGARPFLERVIKLSPQSKYAATAKKALKELDNEPAIIH